MIEDKILGSITVRMSYKMIENLDKIYGKGKKYRDRSDAIRSQIALGSQIEDMMSILSDPEKKKQFEDKFQSLMKEKDLEKSLETMDESELNAVIFFATNLKEKKVEQMLIDIK